MGIQVQPCCCGQAGCAYATDSFTRSDNSDINVGSPVAYVVESGSWSIASNRLTTSDSNALLKIDIAQPEHLPLFVVSIRLPTVAAGNSYVIQLGSDGPQVKYDIVNSAGTLRCLVSLCDSSGTMISQYDMGVAANDYIQAWAGNCWNTSGSRPGQFRFGGRTAVSNLVCGEIFPTTNTWWGQFGQPMLDAEMGTDTHVYFGTGTLASAVTFTGLQVVRQMSGSDFAGTPPTSCTGTPANCAQMVDNCNVVQFNSPGFEPLANPNTLVDLSRANINVTSGTWTLSNGIFTTSDSNASLEILVAPPDQAIENWLEVDITMYQPQLGTAGPDPSQVTVAKFSHDSGNHFVIWSSGNTWWDPEAYYPAGDTDGGGGPAGHGAVVIGAEPTIALNDKVLTTGNFADPAYGNLGPAWSGTLQNYLSESGGGGSTAPGNIFQHQRLGSCMEHGSGWTGFIWGAIAGARFPGQPAIGYPYDPPRGANPGANRIVLATGNVAYGPVTFQVAQWNKIYNVDNTGVNESNTTYGSKFCLRCGQQCACGNDAPVELTVELDLGTLTNNFCSDCTTLTGEFTLRCYAGTTDGIGGSSCTYRYQQNFCPSGPIDGYPGGLGGLILTMIASLHAAGTSSNTGITYSSPYLDFSIQYGLGVSSALWRYSGLLPTSGSCLGDVMLSLAAGDPLESLGAALACSGSFASTLTAHLS
jgi:hypothetical protein